MTFDPDKFLAETATPQNIQAQSQQFDPDKFLAETAPVESVQVQPGQEANLGFINRAKYSIEPLESNRRALLVEQYGAENVEQDPSGNVWVTKDGTKRPVNRQGASFSDIPEFAASTIEAVPAAIGSAAGLFAGAGFASVPAAIVMGAAGGAAGSITRQGISALLGTPQIAKPIERVAETGLSAVFGGGASALGAGAKALKEPIKRGLSNAAQFTKRIGSDLASHLPETFLDVSEILYKSSGDVIDGMKKYFSPSVASDAKAFQATAAKHNLPLLEEHLYGPASDITIGTKHLREKPFAQELRIKFNEALGQVNNAIDSTIAKVSPGKQLNSAQEAGDYISDSMRKAGKEFFDSLDVTYKTIVKNAPGLELSEKSQRSIYSSLNGIQKMAKGIQQRGLGERKKEAGILLDAVDSLRQGNGSLKQTVEALKNIGDEAFRKAAHGTEKVSLYQKELQGLYFDVQKQIINSVRTEYGEDAAKQLLKNNALVHQFLGDKNILKKLVGGEDIAGEKVFNALVKSGDSKMATTLRAFLPKENVQAIKSAALNGLVKRNADGHILYRATINNIEKKKDFLASLFEPQELQEVGDLLHYGARAGDGMLNTSKTNVSKEYSGVLNAIGQTALNTVKGKSYIEMAKRSAQRKAKQQSQRKAINLAPGGYAKEIVAYGQIGNVLAGQKQQQIAYDTRGPKQRRQISSEQ